MWLLLVGLAVLAGDSLGQVGLRFPTSPLLPITPIAGFHNRPIAAQQSFSRPIAASSSFNSNTFGSSSGPVFTGDRTDPCRPSPCGPNTRCEVTTNGIARCKCLDNFVPDGNTINGCKPQCVSDSDCPDDYRCQATKCVRVCASGACGLNANCEGRSHRAICSCMSGFNGNANSACRRAMAVVRDAPPAPPLDPCIPNPCGNNAECRAQGERPVCSCPFGYEGDPLTNCIRGECTAHSDCPGHLACKALKCIDPCATGICGRDSECTVRTNQPICSCPRNYVGDPFVSCRRFDPSELCNPTPCGQNTNCKVRTDNSGSSRAVCSCVENYLGNPLTGCQPECVRDTDCNPTQHCKNNLCRNPCVGACGDGAYCDVRSHRAVCTCPQYFQGDAQVRCTAECTAHEDCRDFQACFQLRCIDPCQGACGTGADCKVEGHTPICSCPRGYTGDPFVSCRPFTKEDLCRDNPCGSSADCTPGFDREGNDRPVCTCPHGYIGNPLVSCQRGECETHTQCPDHQACYGFMCQSPCVTETGSVCGINADCKVKNNQPICSCPRGYTGNPLTECNVGRTSSSNRFFVGRTSK